MRPRPSARTASRLRDISDRVLPAEEIRATLAVPISASEREDVLSLIRWVNTQAAIPSSLSWQC
jgi:hypothetical protein